jgi:hypothetical protein
MRTLQREPPSNVAIEWLLEGAIPSGAIVCILDEGDGDPQGVLDAGADVVIYLHSADPATLSGVPFLLSVIWRARLVPGHSPPAPFWVRWTDAGLVRVGEQHAA